MNKVWDEADFLYTDKHQSFLQVDTTILVGLVGHGQIANQI